jgi:hypothetical protein
VTDSRALRECALSSKTPCAPWSSPGIASAGCQRFASLVGDGEHHDLVLEMSDREFTDEPADAGRLWAGTEEAWWRVVPDCGGLIAIADARHAYAVLHGLTSASGAMVAAATTSLPERLEGGRNTTTATRGSGTSATPAWPSPRTARSRCSKGPSGSSPSGCSPTGRISCRGTR